MRYKPKVRARMGQNWFVFSSSSPLYVSSDPAPCFSSPQPKENSYSRTFYSRGPNFNALLKYLLGFWMEDSE